VARQLTWASFGSRCEKTNLPPFSSLLASPPFYPPLTLWDPHVRVIFNLSLLSRLPATLAVGPPHGRSTPMPGRCPVSGATGVQLPPLDSPTACARASSCAELAGVRSLLAPQAALAEPPALSSPERSLPGSGRWWLRNRRSRGRRRLSRGRSSLGRQLLARSRKSGEWPLLSLQLATAR
jgi:hypothetical protein